ncbi:uncharacterized protein KY384_000132 [Bacidia gigantensis]|uniref:uncharacterized protein n=1 Tax=Bacidia gigantensis TaxID=2732470 RepID=UPI001D0366C0|nr:uncharacterized protein KY384_000132 [Bacidia gigantensis]KAG8526139.1 hypothetical protein KY384_000132 [Bacidia gigantensis]
MDSKFSETSASRFLPWIFVAFVAAYILNTLYQAYATPLRDIPGPWLAKLTRFWLFNANIQRNFHSTNVNLHRTYGPIVRIAPNEYSVDDPEAAQNSPWYLGFANPTAEQHVFTIQDVKHHAARLRQVKNLFQLGALMKFENHVDRMMNVFLNQLETFAKQDQSFDLAEWFNLFSFDTIGAMTFGKPFGVLEEGGDINDIISNIAMVSRYGASLGVFHEFYPLIYRVLQLFAPKKIVGIAFVEQFTTEVTEEWKQQSEKDRLIHDENQTGEDSTVIDILGSLLAKHSKSPETFSVADARYHVIPNILAGGHTTAISFAATMHCLMKDPRVLSKLREALGDLTRDQESGHYSLKQTQDCTYLQAVIKESLRLFPAIGNPLARMAPKGGLTILGRYFPEGTILGINPWVAHINPSVFGADAQTFRPERWLESQENADHMEQYMLTVSSPSTPPHPLPPSPPQPLLTHPPS